ncbi:hypothetical protein quinque_009041 [Culex quinquefasciatus]
MRIKRSAYILFSHFCEMAGVRRAKCAAWSSRAMSSWYAVRTRPGRGREWTIRMVNQALRRGIHTYTDIHYNT